jgi:hypothetical protein
MTIKIHLFYSFLVHSVILTYLVSLPIYKGSIHLKSFEDYFVYLTNEQGENAGGPPSTYKVKEPEVLDQGRIEGTKNVLKTGKADAKRWPQPLREEKIAVSEHEPATENRVPLEPSGAEKSLKKEPSIKEKEIEAGKEKVVVLKGGIAEVKVFEKTPQTVKVFEKTPQTVKVFEKTPQTVKEPPKPLLPETDAGLILKTMHGKMMIPLEEAFKEEVQVKKEIKTEEKAGHKVKEAVKDKAASEKKTLNETPPPTIHESFLETDAELSLKTIYDNMMIPFEEPFKEEVSHAGKPGHEMRRVAENRATSAKVNEVKEFSKVEKVLKEKVSAVNEITVAKEEIRKSESLLAQKANVKSFPQTEKIKETAKPQTGEKPDKGVFDTAVSPLETKETPSAALPETDAGLILKTMYGKMMIPFEEAFKEERLQAEKLEAEEASLKAKKTSSLAFSEKDIGTPDNPIYNKVTASEERLEEKTPQVKDKEELGVEILTPEKNTMPSQKDYFLKLDNKKQITTEIEPEAKEETIGEEKSPPLGIPVSDVLLLKDIRIEVFFKDADMSDVLLHLLKKAHPMENRKDDSVKQKEVEVVEETNIAGTSGIKRVFYVAKAEKGLYTFVIMNKANKAYEADVVFRLFERKAGGRIKEYKSIELPPNTALKLKFILPEAVFWDDEYYFTGTIESSNTLTKFNDKTGLIWKEEKDY